VREPCDPDGITCGRGAPASPASAMDWLSVVIQMDGAGFAGPISGGQPPPRPCSRARCKAVSKQAQQSPLPFDQPFTSQPRPPKHKRASTSPNNLSSPSHAGAEWRRAALPPWRTMLPGTAPKLPAVSIAAFTNPPGTAPGASGPGSRSCRPLLTDLQARSAQDCAPELAARARPSLLLPMTPQAIWSQQAQVTANASEMGSTWFGRAGRGERIKANRSIRKRCPFGFVTLTGKWPDLNWFARTWP